MVGTVADEDWASLAEMVRQRRAHLDLRRQGDLEALGGPSEGTVRNIEQAARSKYAPRTKVQLERALQWWPGAVDAILTGQLSGDGLKYLITKPLVPEHNEGPDWRTRVVASNGTAPVSILGEILTDEIDARGWTQDAFARRMTMSRSAFDDIVNGRAHISRRQAEQIAYALGTSVSMWERLDRVPPLR